MESLEKRLKASNEAKSRLAKDKKSLAAKTARAEGEEQCSGAAPGSETERLALKQYVPGKKSPRSRRCGLDSRKE